MVTEAKFESDRQSRTTAVNSLQAGLVSAAWFWLGWLLAQALCVYNECGRLLNSIDSPAGVFGWFTNWNAETTLPFVVLTALPFLILFRERLKVAGQRSDAIAGKLSMLESAEAAETSMCSESLGNGDGYCVSLKARMVGFCVVFLVSLMASAWIGFTPIETQHGFERMRVSFSELPPAYHDEFSYQLQARTFLAGRLAWPAILVQPDLFHQIHVLNVPGTASRYFPWTGLWIAPFESVGHPIWGHWLAGAIAGSFFFLSLAQMLRLKWSLLGGILIGASPGIAVFSNLLLAHHPTMMALSVFSWSFLRLMHSRLIRYAWVAAAALTLAMLGRPMTAAGFALPSGMWLLWRLVKVFAFRQSHANAESQIKWLTATAMAFMKCITGGMLSLGVMNHAITGSWTTSAYQLYTDTWTPRHQYGFDNVVKAEARLQRSLIQNESDDVGNEAGSRPDVLKSYDRWATNLTPAAAITNVSNRILASSQWTLSMVPLLMFLVVAMGKALRGSQDIRLRLLWLSVISLHAVHVPYWFDGIMHWHYVFESAPVLLMLCATGAAVSWDYLSSRLNARTAFVWVIVLLASGWLPGWLTVDGAWGASKVKLAVGELAFSKVRMDQFQWLIHSSGVLKPALILVDESDSDPQLSFIINPPDLRGDVLVCRLPQQKDTLAELKSAFADREFYRFDPHAFVLISIE